jgi:hypothetical protein
LTDNARAFSLDTSTNTDTPDIAASRRSAMMMSEDAKFALGY